MMLVKGVLMSCDTLVISSVFRRSLFSFWSTASFIPPEMAFRFSPRHLKSQNMWAVSTFVSRAPSASVSLQTSIFSSCKALLIRKNRTFELTPAGEYFYEHSKTLTDLAAKLCSESRKIALNENASLRLGYLKNYGGHEFQNAIAAFAGKYPNVDISIF